MIHASERWQNTARATGGGGCGGNLSALKWLCFFWHKRVLTSKPFELKVEVNSAQLKAAATPEEGSKDAPSESKEVKWTGRRLHFECSAPPVRTKCDLICTTKNLKFLLWKERDNESVIIKFYDSLLRRRPSSPSPSKPKHSTAFHGRPRWTHRRGYTAPLWPTRNTARNVSSLSTEDVYPEQISAGTSRKL